MTVSRCVSRAARHWTRERRGARVVRGAAYGAAFTGIVGLPLSVFFLRGAFFMSVPAVIGGWRAL
ncbi:MAG: hypothetical protein AMXMBFR34_08560 [Myxococcaceae bacterium]